MDCKFINQNDIQERYLFDRLSESEKTEYLAHLNSCDSCKSKLESEKELIWSVRQLSKNEMKSEISRHVAEIKSKQKDVSWDMILKVAAIFFFLVITPGLVYYYQSVEPPKISELYDFNEVLSQQKEIENVEDESVVEESDNKEDIRIAAIEKRKRAKEIGVTGIIKSTGGAAVEPSTHPALSKPADDSDEFEKEIDSKTLENLLRETNIRKSAVPKTSMQSTSLTKPAKKSVPLVESPSEVAAEDGREYEAGQPLPPPPESIIPDLEKFQKPIFSSIGGQEINRAKSLSSEKMGAASRSMYNHTKAEQMSADEIAAAGQAKSGQSSVDKLSENNIVKLDYKINDQTIIVNLLPLYDNTDFYLQEILPGSFPVIIKQNVSVTLAMDWFINSAMRKVKPDDILLNLGKSNLLYVNILNTKFYQIDLKSDSTKAVSIP